MTTMAPPLVAKLAADWKALFPSAKLSGIVGDLSHKKRGGYHISRADQTNPENYSVVRPDDKVGPADAAAAIDMTMNTVDMKKCTVRLVAAYNNVNDPRRKYLNAFNGTINGKDPKRWDIYARTGKWATADHLWHVHLEIRRRYVNSATAMKAILSILKGETVAQYLRSIGVVPAPPAPVAAKALTAPKWPGKTFTRKDTMKPDKDLAKWQARMLARGWKSIGTPDGVFGAKTESVVRRYQGVCKVKVDGEIGRITWALPWSRPLGS